MDPHHENSRPQVGGKGAAHDVDDLRAVRAWAESRTIFVELHDERVIGFSADCLGRLESATDEQIAKIQLDADGRALRWEEVDEGITVRGIIDNDRRQRLSPEDRHAEDRAWRLARRPSVDDAAARLRPSRQRDEERAEEALRLLLEIAPENAPELHGRMIARLGQCALEHAKGGRLPLELAPAAANAAMAGEDIATMLRDAPHLSADEVAAELVRLQDEHTRAFEARQHCHGDRDAERAFLLIEHLRACAGVVPRASDRPKEPSVEDAAAWLALSQDEQRRQVESSREWANATDAKTRTRLATRENRLVRLAFWWQRGTNGFERIERSEDSVRAGLARAEELVRSGAWARCLSGIDSAALQGWLLAMSHGRSRKIGDGYQSGCKGRGERLSSRDEALISRLVFPGWSTTDATAETRIGKARRAREGHYRVTRPPRTAEGSDKRERGQKQKRKRGKKQAKRARQNYHTKNAVSSARETEVSLGACKAPTSPQRASNSGSAGSRANMAFRSSRRR
jgi:hypothetical protein